MLSNLNDKENENGQLFIYADLLVDGLQHLAHGVLNHLVLERRNPNRPRLDAVPFGNVHPLNRRRPVRARLEAIQ